FTAIEDDSVEIFWGAYLGTDNEILASGRLHECKDEIQKIKADARTRHGWIMDTYLLRKTVAS
ncbi:MAG: precorrin-6A synthase (deacetylating), partial [Hyphomicrobium sp.]|nr:precorrin-6A synthase (deacetylating) [Hyphomicrobium sp.]